MIKENLIDELKQYHCPRWSDLPDFDIYMDQVIFFINDRLLPLSFDDQKNDKVITSNMVNNYVKNSIVTPPIKKHYNQYHLAFLIAVSILKRCYSLSEITQLIRIAQSMQDSSIESVYDSFSACFDHYLHQIMNYGTVKEEFVFQEIHREHILMISVVKTVIYKIYTELEILNFSLENE